jgi:hypothetical protein
MHSNHFTLTISQSNSDGGDFAIHIKEPNKQEKLLVHLRFMPSSIFNSAYLDSVLELLTKMLARRVIEWQVAPEDSNISLEDQEEAKEVVNRVLDKIKRSSIG